MFRTNSMKAYRKLSKMNLYATKMNTTGITKTWVIVQLC